MEILNQAGGIAIIGAGPAGMFAYKAFIETAGCPRNITIFEKGNHPGMGMPYSVMGANTEHVTNVSANEIPDIVIPIKDWLQKAPTTMLQKFGISIENFNEYKVLPRLLFGEYLSAQFDMLKTKAKEAGIKTHLILNTSVVDAIDDPENGQVKVITADNVAYQFEHIIICTGHRWPKTSEGKVPGWFDSPYPPAKLASITNYPVAIKGASLTAIDAIRTLSRSNGKFVETDNGLRYELNDTSPDFRLVLHSLGGLMPAIRFHLQDSHLSQGHSFTEEEITAIRDQHQGFVPLDFVFDKIFKQPLEEADAGLYADIHEMNMESFVEHMMNLREKLDAFTLFKAEYREADKSIKRRQSVYWKEMLAVLSYEMNYAAKHFSAEDMIRLKKNLMPLISIIIAFVPQSSCEELIALYDANVLSMQPVDIKSEVIPMPTGGCRYTFTNELGEKTEERYNMFVNAVGQSAFMLQDFIFPSLVQNKTVSEAHTRFKDPAAAVAEIDAGSKQVVSTAPGEYWLKVPGITINDHFQVLDEFGKYNPRIYIMAVPYISGLNPDYSGLDFCERASGVVAQRLVKDLVGVEKVA